MRERTGTCDEATFWKAVAELDWKGRCKEPRVYETLKDEILAHWDDTFVRSFDEMLDEKVGHLYGVIEKFEQANDVSCGCGDDGFGDLRHHIVGMGKEEYEAVLEDPGLAVKRGQSYDYVESFAYCIPHLAEKPDLTLEEAREVAREHALRHRDYGDESDPCPHGIEMHALRMLHGDRADRMPEYYAAWAKRELGDIETLLDSRFAERVGVEDLVKVRDTLVKVAEGDVFQQWFDVKKVVERVMKRRKVVLEEERANLAALSYPRCASMENLFGDGATHFGRPAATTTFKGFPQLRRG